MACAAIPEAAANAANNPIEYLARLFETGNYPPRWTCGYWSPFEGWTHIVADLLIAGAYLAIPVVLAYFILRRRDVPFSGIFWLFVAFILACGITHFVDALMFHAPAYRFLGLMKVLTAAVSWATVVGLVRVAPDALALPGTARLAEDLQREVAQRRAAEAALARESERYQALVLATSNIVFRVDRDGALRDIAHWTERTGVPEGLPLAEALAHATPPDYPLESVQAACRQMRSSDATIDLSIPLRLDGGPPRIHQMRLVAIRWGGPEAEWVGALDDIEEQVHGQRARRALEQERLHVQKLESLGVLAGGVAHDFNNILVAILGNTSLALMDLRGDSPARRALLDAEKAAQRAAALANQMLAYSGKGRFLVRALNPAREVLSSRALLESAAAGNARVEFDFPERLPIVEADAAQLHQLVLNLVANAAEAIEEASADNAPGVVRVAFSARDCAAEHLQSRFVQPPPAPGRFVAIEVSDNGAGMDEATLARIFDPFFTTKFTGRGLGLSAALGIVAGHGGTIQVRTQPGKGTTFRVLLPALQEESVCADSDGGAAAGARRTQAPAGILVVDDDESVRGFCVQVLERAGHRVQQAADGAKALEAIVAAPTPFDLVLLDLTMPGLSGAEVLKRLRAAGDATPVMLTSGYDESAVRARLGEIEAQGFLKKPYTADGILEAVEAAVAKGRGAGA